LRGLSAFLAEAAQGPVEVLPPPSPRKYWTRRGLAEWLAANLVTDPPAIVGIDHGFSFPIEYFRKYGLPLNWPGFLDDFHAHWPTDEANTYVDFVRDGVVGNAAARSGSNKWRRLTERRAGAAKSVFHFDVQGAVAKSTHAGLPWLRYLRGRLKEKIHFWPFDGWDPPKGSSVVLEVYPALWKHLFQNEGRSAHQQDAFLVAAWLHEADRSGELARQLRGPSDPAERSQAEIEGWILGVQ
jgi:hypothetical protein